MTSMTSSTTTQYLPRDAGRLAYDVQGSGPLVVAVPGMGDLRSTYRFVVPHLVAAGFRVATLDLRGHGESDVDFDSFDDVAAASDLVALIEHLGGPATVIGNSMAAGAAVIAGPLFATCRCRQEWASP
jgi:pimeloyl-ACP methyl ester carboxylesterase